MRVRRSYNNDMAFPISGEKRRFKMQILIVELIAIISASFVFLGKQKRVVVPAYIVLIIVLGVKLLLIQDFDTIYLSITLFVLSTGRLVLKH